MEKSWHCCFTLLWKRTTKECLETRSGERNVDIGFQVQLEEDGVVEQGKAGWRLVICCLCFTGSNKTCLNEVK